jgi:hypothetical protein
MKWSLFPGFFLIGLCVEKGRGRRSGIGAENRVNGRKGTTLAVGLNPAYEHSERNERPVPVRGEPVWGAKKRVKRMCWMTGGEGITNLQFFKLKKVENLKKTRSVTKSGKVNAGMECRELSFKPAWTTLSY